MLSGFIAGLIVAAILSIFDVDNMLIEVIQPFISDVRLTTAHYYITFALLGMIGGAFK